MVAAVLKDLDASIEKAFEALARLLGKIRTGRANVSILDGIRVDYYGTPTPLTGMASLAVPEPRLITIKPWDKAALKDIERALKEANLGVNPMNDGEIIRLPFPPLTEERRKDAGKPPPLPFPPLTEERRKDIAKQVKAKGEEHKVAIRNLRRDANER